MIYLKIKNDEVLANAFEITEPDLVISNQEWTDCGCHAYIADGEIVLGYPAPTKEEQSKKRELAYKEEVDPITCHINRLKDKEQTEEIVAEIEALIAERDEKVEEIKERYPYPTDPIYEEEKIG